MCLRCLPPTVSVVECFGFGVSWSCNDKRERKREKVRSDIFRNLHQKPRKALMFAVEKIYINTQLKYFSSVPLSVNRRTTTQCITTDDARTHGSELCQCCINVVLTFCQRLQWKAEQSPRCRKRTSGSSNNVVTSVLI